MHVARVGTRVPFANDDPFFQTTPTTVDAAVETFCRKLGALKASFIFIPVAPAPGENGMCHLNVLEQIGRRGGRPVFGWAIWANQLFLTAEFHAGRGHRRDAGRRGRDRHPSLRPTSDIPSIRFQQGGLKIARCEQWDKWTWPPLPRRLTHYRLRSGSTRKNVPLERAWI
jgi:hypothetical protein